MARRLLGLSHSDKVIAVSDDVITAEPLGPRVVSVEPLEGYRLLVGFTNGEQRLFDAVRLFDYPAFGRLRDESFFRLAKVAYGTIVWPENIDY
jgi:hypothetical protein